MKTSQCAEAENKSPLRMDILKKIDEDTKSAMRAGEKIRLQVLRSLRSVIKNAEIAKRAVLEEADVLKVIQTELKKRKESITAYITAQRHELAEQEKKESEILSDYLPAQMTDEDIDAIVKEMAGTLGVTDKKEFGKLMGPVMKEVGVRADGTRVRARVEKFFS